MNKFFTTLIAASLTALILAVGCGAWLFWQSWEETKRLERQNRELQATLEASRIRLDNFCEYPMEALCDVNADTGSVMSSMSDLHTALPEPPALPKASAPVEAKPEPQLTAPSTEKPAAEPVPEPADITAPIPASTAPESAPEEIVSPAAPVLPEKSATLPATPDEGNPVSESSSHVAQSHAPVPQSALKGQEEQPKKTWSTLEQSEEHMKLRIAGAGSSLTAEDRMLSEPPRYEVTLHGLWKIAPKRLKTSLVTDIRREFRHNDTVLTFLLARQPEQCLLEQEDARTISISIR